MAFYVGALNLVPGSIPIPSATNTGSFLISNGDGTTFWAYPGSPQSQISAGATGANFQFRSILTHGYQHGGYKSSSMWRSVHKTWHTTDTTVSCGEQLDLPWSYSATTWSDYSCFVHGSTSSAVGTASSHTSSYNLHTGMARTQNTGLAGGANTTSVTYPTNATVFGYSGNDPANQSVPYGESGKPQGTGSWELVVARSYAAGATNQAGQVGYISGGSESLATDKLHFPTEVMYSGPARSGDTLVSHATAAYGEFNSYWSFGGQLRKSVFATDVWSTWTPGTAASTDGVTKALTTKLGYHYIGTSSNVTSGFQKFNDTTGTTINGALTKLVAMGEENFQMGQSWGYVLGTYTTGQANYSAKINYLTDVWTAGGTAMQPKGHAGAASGGCSSASATVTANYW